MQGVGWEKLGRWYGDLLVTYLVHQGESQMVSPVFQGGPPKLIPQQTGDAGVVAGVSLVTDDTRCAAVHSLKLGLVFLEVWVPNVSMSAATTPLPLTCRIKKETPEEDHSPSRPRKREWKTY